MDTNTKSTFPHTSGRRNRRHSTEFKRAVVEQSYLPGASVARLARDHGINANQVFAWRKLHRDAAFAHVTGSPTVLLPVSVSTSIPEDAVPALNEGAPLTGTLELTIGKTRLTISGSPDSVILRTVLAQLLR